jgi:hypothetical protein
MNNFFIKDDVNNIYYVIQEDTTTEDGVTTFYLEQINNILTKYYINKKFIKNYEFNEKTIKEYIDDLNKDSGGKYKFGDILISNSYNCTIKNIFNIINNKNTNMDILENKDIGHWQINMSTRFIREKINNKYYIVCQDFRKGECWLEEINKNILELSDVKTEKKFLQNNKFLGRYIRDLNSKEYQFEESFVAYNIMEFFHIVYSIFNDQPLSAKEA